MLTYDSMNNNGFNPSGKIGGSWTRMGNISVGSIDFGAWRRTK